MLEIRVGEFADRFERSVFMAENEGRMLHAIEEGRFHDGVLRHIEKFQTITDLERSMKGVVADQISSEAGVAAETIEVVSGGQGGPLIESDGRAAGHFEHVRHVGGGGEVEDGNPGSAILKEVEHCGVKDARVQDRSLSWFEPQLLELVARPGAFEQAVQEIEVVIWFRDPVSAAEIEGGELCASQDVAKVVVDGLESGGEIIAALLAEGVKVQAAESIEIGIVEVLWGDPEARARHAGIIERGLAGGAAGINAQSEAECAALGTRVMEGAFLPVLPMAEGIEVEVGGEIEQFRVGVGVGGPTGQDLAAKEFVRELGFPEARRAAAIEMASQERERLGESEGLEGVRDLAAGPLLEFGKDLAVGAHHGEIDEVSWRGPRHGRQCA